MSWVKRLAAGVVSALRCAQQEDPVLAAGFEKRVEALIAAAPPPVSAWDRPSEQTVRVVAQPATPGFTALPRGAFDATPLRAAASRQHR
jgi:hypothetical protein